MLIFLFRFCFIFREQVPTCNAIQFNSGELKQMRSQLNVPIRGAQIMFLTAGVRILLKGFITIIFKKKH